ncbi:hypothetical protein WA026_022293 [Henosepilachna vigintioctopunctata]|uniref:Sugar phosphate phosphatase n=1 Tax=Henosepilachna vigintioctopunctata TaxID=420089 RepID=A0AAW1VFN8_9CUCU
MSLVTARPCFCAYNRTMDIRTPRNVKLSAFYRRSFAFRTVRDRLPVILTKTIDSLSQQKDDIAKEYGNEAREDIKNVIGKLSRLKYEIQTNKPLKNIRSKASDANTYNEFIRERDSQEGPPTPFHSVWLLVECYMYRKIWEAFEKTKFLKEFDPFQTNKEKLFHSSIDQMKETIAYLQKITETPSPNKDEFFMLLQMNLWSNKCDLSLHPDGVNPVLTNQINELSDKILVNDSEKVWNALIDSSGDVVDIVLDNAGAELIADLALADYLIKKGICKKVNFHVKKIPWFISDVTLKDFKWTIEQLSKMYEEPLVQSTGDAWSKNFENLNWTIKTSDFWTLPVEYAHMHKYDRILYEELSLSKLIFLKGDVSFRKLFREINYNPEAPVAEAQGFFGPSKICSIRTIKSEIICGFPKGLADKCEIENKKWMETGEYGVIQFSDKIVPLMEESELKIFSNLLPVIKSGESAMSMWAGIIAVAADTSCLCRN